MKYSGSIALLLAAPLAGFAQNTIFTDTFGNGSTFNGVSTPGGTPAASFTSYDFASSKTGAESISSGHLTFGLSSATTSGFVEAQAVFTSTPVVLATVNDYVDLTYTFTDTANLLNTANSAIYSGLYNSGGATPVAGTAGVTGNAVSLSTASSSPFATGNAAGWQGMVGRFTGSGGTSAQYVRPVQSGAGTTSANQDLIGNNFGSGAYNNPTGATAGTSASAVALTTGSQYTVDYRYTLSAAGQLTVTENLYSGTTASGTALSAVTGTLTTTLNNIDGLAIGVRNSSTTSANPQIDVNDIIVTDNIQPAPEPSIFALVGVGALGLVWYRRQTTRPA